MSSALEAAVDAASSAEKLLLCHRMVQNMDGAAVSFLQQVRTCLHVTAATRVLTCMMAHGQVGVCHTALEAVIMVAIVVNDASATLCIAF